MLQDPAPCPGSCPCCHCPPSLSLLGALRGARAALAILDMAPRDCHIAAPHVASRCSDAFAAAAPLAARSWASAPGAAFSQTQALAGDQLALHPPCAPCQGEEGLEKPRQTQISTKPCLLRALCPAPHPTSSPWGSAPRAPLCWILRCDHPHRRGSPCACWRPGRGKPRRSGASNLHYFGSHGAAWASWPFGSPT